MVSINDIECSYALDPDYVFPWEDEFVNNQSGKIIFPLRKESYNLWQKWKSTPDALIAILEDPKLGKWTTKYVVVGYMDLWTYRIIRNQQEF